MCGSGQGLGCAANAKGSGQSSFIFYFSSSCGICPIHTTREQAPRNGVLELELEDVEKLDKTKGGTTTLRTEHRHEKSVTAAYWDPRGRSIVSTSYDDALRSTSPFAE